MYDNRWHYYFQIITFAKYFFLHSKGMATNFIIQRSIEHGGIFPKEEVATLCRLAGWSEASGAWTLYVKDVFETHLDTSGLIYSDLRTAEQRSRYLKTIPSNYNFRLIEPQKNLTSAEDCLEFGKQEYTNFFNDFPVKKLGKSIAEIEKVIDTLHEGSVYEGMEFKELKHSLHNAKKQATKVFCSEKNAEMHDNARKQKPHPNKQPFQTPLSETDYLTNFQAKSATSLRQFSPNSGDDVQCPFKHPGWNKNMSPATKHCWYCAECGKCFHISGGFSSSTI